MCNPSWYWMTLLALLYLWLFMCCWIFSLNTYTCHGKDFIFLDIHTKLLVPYLLERKSSLFNYYSKNTVVGSLCLHKIVFAVLSHQPSLAEGLKKESICSVTHACKLLWMEQNYRQSSIAQWVTDLYHYRSLKSPFHLISHLFTSESQSCHCTLCCESSQLQNCNL